MAEASKFHYRVLEEVAQSCLPPNIICASVAEYADGSHLQTLVERLSGEKMPHRMDLIGKILKKKKNDGSYKPIETFLRSKGVPMTKIKGFSYPLSNDEVYTFLEVVCLHYKVTVPCRQALPNFVSNDPRECLLNWLGTNMPPGARRIQGFHDLEWKTGEYFAALVHAKSDGEKYRDWQLNYCNITLNKIFRDAAYCLLGINSLLTEEDFADGVVPDTAMMLYLSQFVTARYVPRTNKSGDEEQINYYDIPSSKPVITNKGADMENLSEDVTHHYDQTESHYTIPHEYIVMGPELPREPGIKEFQGSRDMEAAWSHLEEEQREEILPYFRTRRCLLKYNPIGQGVSGNVYKGRFKDRNMQTMVAAKCIYISEKEDADVAQKKWRNVFTEIYNMAQLRHENVIELIAVVIYDKLPHLIMPLLERDLLEYVTSNKLKIPKPELNTKVLDVAMALQYLSELEYIHRDVAARNCMIDRRGRVKLGDLGLMRDSLTYIHIGQSTIPFRWAAPEVLNREPSSAMSDVWSFGVLYWEVFSWGEEPYKEIREPHDLTRSLESRNRLQKPEFATDQEYELMTDCWEHEPEDRPDFSKIVQQIKSMILPSAKTEYSTTREEGDISQVNPQVIPGKVDQIPKEKPIARPQPRPRFGPRPGPVPVHLVQPMVPVQRAQAHSDSPVEGIVSAPYNTSRGNSPGSDTPPALPPRNRNVRIYHQQEKSGDESD